jgi:hypothetical protein
MVSIRMSGGRVADRAAGDRAVTAGSFAWAAALALPGALVVYTGLSDGGFFADTTATLAVWMALLLGAWVAVGRDPVAGISPRLIVAAAALGLFAVWTLLSATWGSPGRAVVEFDRALLYLLTLVFFGSLPMTPGRLRWMVRGVALAAVVLCAVGFVSRTLPELLATTFEEPRLGYPVGYSNALGLLGAVGAILSVYLTTSGREPDAVRVLAAGALPVLAATVYLTFSRGAMAAGAIGLALYVVLARPRLFLTGMLVAAPASVVAVIAARGAVTLSTVSKPTAALVSQGRSVADVVAMCALAAIVGRALLLLVDARRLRRREPLLSGPIAVALGVLALSAAFVAIVGSGAPGFVDRQYRGFLERPEERRTGDLRSRLTDPSGSGRLDFWKVAVRGFESERLHGHGAGTYELIWHRHGPYGFELFDGHSLYLESLAELGIVGLALVIAAVVALLVGVARRIRGLDRSVFAAVFAVSVAWALHAGMDWDWEMPVVTLPVFALGGAALAARPRPPLELDRYIKRWHRWALRAGGVVICLLLAMLPAAVASSQRHLDASARGFKHGDCTAALREAAASIDALPVRPEPYELLGYCEFGRGHLRTAVRAEQTAVRLDPDNWHYRYALAIVRAAAGLDPRPSARRAHQLYPRESRAIGAVKAFATNDPRLWRKRALRQTLPTN